MIGLGPAGPRGPEPDAPGGELLPWPLPPVEAPALEPVDPEADRPYWIALGSVPGIGPVTFGRLVARHGSAHAAWRAGPAALVELPRVAAEAAAAWRTARRERAPAIAAAIEAGTVRAGGRVVTSLDADYPASLEHCDPRPPVLHIAGDLAGLQATCVAIVGTRRASGYGRACATEIADELARAGVTVISGLALGIDGDAHAAAIDAGGRSAAVLPSPLGAVYPPRHRRLAGRLLDTGGLLISELPTGRAIGKPDFARRNRLIAALALAVVVVEAPDRSGALLTAAAAVELGRDLYAVPGPIDAVASRGCNRLIADHAAAIVTSAVGLLQQIGVHARRSDGTVVGSLSEAEGVVLAALLDRSASIEELTGRIRLPTGALAGALTLLEARELVTSYGGATFHPTLAARHLADR
ncbi:MAG: DNA-processing protein DprA [Chloroflexota bacterium]|nr:DNA-processing protein DprA [Chloroflexota bacterium]